MTGRAFTPRVSMPHATIDAILPPAATRPRFGPNFFVSAGRSELIDASRPPRFSTLNARCLESPPIASSTTSCGGSTSSKRSFV